MPGGFGNELRLERLERDLGELMARGLVEPVRDDGEIRYELTDLGREIAPPPVDLEGPGPL